MRIKKGSIAYLAHVQMNKHLYLKRKQSDFQQGGKGYSSTFDSLPSSAENSDECLAVEYGSFDLCISSFGKSNSKHVDILK